MFPSVSFLIVSQSTLKIVEVVFMSTSALFPRTFF